MRTVISAMIVFAFCNSVNASFACNIDSLRKDYDGFYVIFNYCLGKIGNLLALGDPKNVMPDLKALCLLSVSNNEFSVLSRYRSTCSGEPEFKDWEERIKSAKKAYGSN